eukprot:sb/3471211/
MSAKTQRTTSSKSSRRVVFAADALSASDGHDSRVAAHLAALQRQIEAPSVQTFDGTKGGRMDSLIGPTPGSPPLKITSLTSNPSLEVIDEVKTLIGRLESDRNQTIKAYQREVERVKLLQIQVDKVEQKRLYILPKAVQLAIYQLATYLVRLTRPKEKFFNHSFRSDPSDRHVESYSVIFSISENFPA